MVGFVVEFFTCQQGEEEKENEKKEVKNKLIKKSIGSHLAGACTRRASHARPSCGHHA